MDERSDTTATLTRFFGQEEELAALRTALLAETRLVTLTGPGGTGKTRLALEAARLHHLPAAEMARGDGPKGVRF